MQTVASAGLMFFFYRRILDVVGADGLGIWAVVLASTGAVRIGDLGLTGSAVKYTAGRLANGANDEAAQIIETTVLTVAVVGAVLAVGGYWLLNAVLPTFIPIEGLEVARDLLPLAVVSLWFAIVAGAIQSGLDGCGRIDLRNAVAFVAQLVYVGLGWFWVSSWGLQGLAVAQLIQGAFGALACWIILRSVLPETPVLPWRWRRSLFQEMLSYGVQYQALSVIRLLYEPVTKALMSRFGGLDAAGYYEMATLIWTKLRSLIVAAQQALTPEVAMLEETDPEAVDAVYEKANGLNWYLSIPLFTILIAMTPLVSMIWIGRYEETFVIFAVLLGAGWFVNALSGPAFFVLLGTGQMGGVVVSHLTTGVVNALGGVLLGMTYGSSGVALAWVLALTAGAVHLLIRLQRDRGVPFRIPPATVPLAWSACGALVGAAVVFLLRSSAAGAIGAAVTAVTIIAVPVWRLPYRQSVLNVFRRAR